MVKATDADELIQLRKFRDAMVDLSVSNYFGGRLSGFCERDEDDDDHDEAWAIVAGVIEPIIRAEDIAAGRVQWVRIEDGEDA